MFPLNTNMNYPARNIAVIALIACIGAAPLAAQPVAPSQPDTTTTTTTTTSTTTQAATPTTTAVTSTAAAEDQGPIVLSPFEVTSTQDNGYAAQDTLAGTRIRTNLDDVAASIQVIDQQFLNDIGATDNNSLLQYTTNADVYGTRGSYLGLGAGQSVNETNNLIDPQAVNRIRGLAAADNTRGYYLTDIPWDSFNTDRIDILRGPNAILFGLGSPAGIINDTLKEADFSDHGEFTVRFGSWGSARSTLDLNQDIVPGQLAIRLDAMWDDEKFEQNPAFQNQKRLYGSVRWDPQLFKNPAYHTTITANWEHGEINADEPRSVPPQDALTAWWRPNSVSASNPFGGAGKAVANNPYDVYRTDGISTSNDYGLLEPATANYVGWMSDIANQQQPIWLIDGNSGQLYGINGGYINTGAISNTGAPESESTGIPGKRQNAMFIGLNTLNNVAQSLDLPGYQYGQYRAQSLEDPSIFDFYNTLIDGPTAGEYQNWNAYNVDLVETALNNHLGIDLTYDRQTYKNGGNFLLGGQPTISLDLLKNELDYYTTGADGETSQTNPNFGRPYVESGGGNGQQYTSDRETKRADLFAEIKASDFTNNDFLVKLLGKHEFNLEAEDQKYYYTNWQWLDNANSAAWTGLWNGNNGTTDGFNDRQPLAAIYLGGSVINAPSPQNLHIPGITDNVGFTSGNIYYFNPTYQNYSVPYGNVWNVPSNLSNIYYGPPVAGATTQLYQDSNPANLVGWTNFYDQLENYGNMYHPNPALLTEAEKALRETSSYAGSYQGYYWDNAVVLTLGWRYDWVGTKTATAALDEAADSTYNINPSVYNLGGNWPASQIYSGHSLSGGLVVHLNDFLPRNPLPFNVGVTYNDSSNFQVTSAREDVYGNPLPNPKGVTKEWGMVLSTKDNKYYVRLVHYDTTVANDSSTLSNPGQLGATIAQGLRWRNVFLYQLGGYTLNTENEPSYRNSWTNAYPTESASVAQAQEDAAISTWNDIQNYLAGKNFFNYWNFTPTQASVLTTRTQYLTNPGAYQPDPTTVSAYSVPSGGPQGFTVTANTESKGYELEATANPTSQWRITFNASQTTAVENNVGGTTLASFVSYMNSQLYNPDGSLTPAGMLPQYGNPNDAIGPDEWAPFMSAYTLLKLQEGADVPELRKYRFNLITNYTFDHGFLKGFGIGGAYRWESSVVIGYPVNTTTGAFILSQPYYGPAQGYVDLWASYDWKLTRKIHYKIQFNVTNVGEGNHLLPISVEPDGHTWATVIQAPVQQWYLTNDFTF